MRSISQFAVAFPLKVIPELPGVAGNVDLRNQRRTTSGGTIYGMIKTTIYLPESLKRQVELQARQRSCSEAEVIRQAIRDAVVRPKPRHSIIPGDDSWVEHIDDYMEGFGER